MMSDTQILTSLQEKRRKEETGSVFQGSFPHPNPRQYKCRWDVAFLSEDGAALLWFRNLCARSYDKVIREIVPPRCKARREGNYVLNRRAPRWADHPLRESRDRLGHEWALPYDLDPDPVADGGHR